MKTGTVSEFDHDRGLGVVTADDGAEYLFHVIEIADGTRSIDLGQSVQFELLAKFGHDQAARIQKV